MKRFFAMMMAMTMMGTTAYAAENTEQEKTAYMSIMRYGKTAYIVDPAVIADYTARMEADLAENGDGQGEDYEFKGDFYRIALHSEERKENTVIPNMENKWKQYSVYRKPVVEIATAEGQQTVWMSAEEQQELLQMVEELYEPQLKYDRYLNLDPKDPKKLGVILNGEVYSFADAYIAKDGKLYVSMEDWNQAFRKQYGNTKQLSLQRENVLCGDRQLGVQPVLKDGMVYLPLRDTVDAFSHLSLKWDGNLKKAVIGEKALEQM